MFKINLKSGDKKIVYKSLSMSVRYLIDEKKLNESLKNIEKVSNFRLSELQRKNFLSDKSSEVRVSRPEGKPDEMIFKKIKIDKNFSSDFFRNHTAGILPGIKNEQLRFLHVFIPRYEYFKSNFYSEEYYYQTFAEGILLGNYSFEKYLSSRSKPENLTVFLHADNDKKLKSAIRNAMFIAEGVEFTRNLQNEPGGALTPDVLAKRVRTQLTKAGVKVTVFDEKEIKKRKMGGLIAVGQGSDNPPRFIVLEYNGSGSAAKKARKIALVGKGVTFDSGGISIKPAQNMGEMKGDMSGAAVVAGTILSAAKLKLPVKILGVIPTAENMLSGKAMRPGDIVITSSGKSIEVDNTDAEGRMILADGLHYACNAKPDMIIDLATLTGACVVALGEFVGGLFTKDTRLSDKLFNAGIRTHERIWPMPMWDDYHLLNKSDVADVKNVGGRWGGAITAAKFLENWVDEKIPWAHIDIAGPSGANNNLNYTKKYLSGFGVRLLCEFLKEK